MGPGGHDGDLLAVLGAGDEPHLEADPGQTQDVGGGAAGEVGGQRDLDVVGPQADVTELGHLAEEVHHEVVGRLVVELVGRADLLDPALVDHHDLVGDLERLLLVVGDEHGGHGHLVVQAAQPLAQLLADLGVEGTERLVEQQHLGLDRQRAGQRHPLALAAGELRRQPVGELRQVHELEQLVDPVGDLGLGLACGSRGRRRRSWPPSCA